MQFNNWQEYLRYLQRTGNNPTEDLHEATAADRVLDLRAVWSDNNFNLVDHITVQQLSFESDDILFNAPYNDRYIPLDELRQLIRNDLAVFKCIATLRALTNNKTITTVYFPDIQINDPNNVSRLRDTVLQLLEANKCLQQVSIKAEHLDEGVHRTQAIGTQDNNFRTGNSAVRTTHRPSQPDDDTLPPNTSNSGTAEATAAVNSSTSKSTKAAKKCTRPERRATKRRYSL